MNFLYYDYLDAVIVIAEEAGKVIMGHYSTEFNVFNKIDNSPLTQADLAANDSIIDALNKLTPKIPIISEESEAIDFNVRKNWHQYWLVDPLDGTREFIKRNGEFTVNIALIDNNVPVLGVVYAPVTSVLYFATYLHGAYKKINTNHVVKIYTRTLNLKKPTVAISRSHIDKKMNRFIKNINQLSGAKPELISMGSSLKICLVAEGLADVYPRLGPTSEWDTAAGHCILREAGGDIVDEAGSTLSYNKKPSLLNPAFFAKGYCEYNWAVYL